VLGTLQALVRGGDFFGVSVDQLIRSHFQSTLGHSFGGFSESILGFSGCDEYYLCLIRGGAADFYLFGGCL
jgi:hypothetical protein